MASAVHHTRGFRDMSAALFAFIDQLGSAGVIIPALGVVGTLLAFFVGRLMLNGRAAPADLVKSDENKSNPAPPVLDPFVHGAASEKRFAYRRPGNSVEVGIADAEGEVELANGWVVDRSAGGLRIAVPVALEVGAVISLRPRQCSAMTPWVQVSVSNCQKHGDDWHVGCKFVRMPAWSVLVQFG
jgi:hypothetical protein